MWYQIFAPAQRVFACVGVLFFCSVAACDKPASIGSDDRTLELASGTVHLDAGVALHDVGVKSSRKGDFFPQQITAKAGDVVRFTSRDTRTHALQITAPTTEGKTMLQASGQLRSPPLVERGQAWVVTLKGLPAGTYTVSCLSHAGAGSLIIQ